MWISVPDRLIPALRTCLEYSHDPELLALEARIAHDLVKQASDAANAYRRAVETCDGTLEVDSDAVVSFGADNGAYVMSWSWVDDANADLPIEEEAEAPA